MHIGTPVPGKCAVKASKWPNDSQWDEDTGNEWTAVKATSSGIEFG